jgi:anti-sigma factor RsiW
MSCRDLVELVTDYLDDALPAAQRERFDAHLAECGDCVTFVAQLEHVARATGTLAESDVPPGALEALRPLLRKVRR